MIPSDEGIRFSPDETGRTFYENSLIKARSLWDIVHVPVIADDSGICCDALDGAPGIYSARYAGPEHMTGDPSGKKCPQQLQNAYLIAQINAACARDSSATRKAHYACAMTLYLDRERFYVVQETMEGEIVSRLDEARGTGGFGYDPIFLLPSINKTAAELTDDEKNAVSHRGRAARLIRKIAEAVLRQEEI